MNKTLLYFKTWMKATGRNLVSAKVLSLVVLLSAVPYAAFSGNGSLSEVSESMQAGTQTVSGTVQDQDGTPLIGVTVTSSPSNGVVTDVNGKFTIKVPSGAELTFSYLGYKTVKVKVGARTTINVKMESDSQQLEEQVVVGYGTQKKVSVVASISSVNSKELRQSSSPNLANALAGRLAGLTSLQSGGSQPGFDDADLYLTDDTERLLTQYAKLDDYGRHTIASVMKVEYDRCSTQGARSTSGSDYELRPSVNVSSDLGGSSVEPLQVLSDHRSL